MCIPTDLLHELQRNFVGKEGYLCSLKRTTLVSELNCGICFQFQPVCLLSTTRTPATELFILEDIVDPRCEHSALTGTDVPTQP